MWSETDFVIHLIIHLSCTYPPFCIYTHPHTTLDFCQKTHITHLHSLSPTNTMTDQTQYHEPPTLPNMSDKTQDPEKPHKKCGGWKAMPFVLGLSLYTHNYFLIFFYLLIGWWWWAGNETFERLGTFGLLSNMMVYLTREFHYTQVAAVNILNIWGGITNFAPLLGAFISDTYLGRFKTIAFGSVSAILVSVVFVSQSIVLLVYPLINYHNLFFYLVYSSSIRYRITFPVLV